MKKDTLTEKQQSCANMLAEWAGGFHHLPKIKAFGTGICINKYGTISTYDFCELTTLVLLAHRDSIRIEIGSSGPGMIKIIAHRRQPMEPDSGLKFHERHPTLDQLVESIQKFKAEHREEDAK